MTQTHDGAEIANRKQAIGLGDRACRFAAALATGPTKVAIAASR